jgi:hypothetical protein
MNAANPSSPDTGDSGGSSDIPAPNPVDLLKKRCRASGISVEEKTVQDGGFSFDYFIVQLPSGRSSRSFHIFDDDDARELLATPFEQITPLGGYAAYLDRETNSIEAVFRPLNRHNARALLRRTFGAYSVGKADDSHQLRVELRSAEGSPLVVIRRSSQLAKASGVSSVFGRPKRTDSKGRLPGVRSA